MIPGLGIVAHINAAKPAALKKLFDAFAGNKKAADSAFNAKFLAKFAGTRFGKAQKMAKFPIMQAIPLARDVGAFGNDSFNYCIKCEIGDGRAIVYFAGPEAEFAFATAATRDVPDPQKFAGLNPIINLIHRDTGDTRDRVDAAES